MDQDIKTVIQYPVGATEFDIPFDYLSRKFVRVSLVADDNRRLLSNITEYRYVSKTRVKLLVETTGFDRVEIRRFTSASERVVDFSDGSVLRAADLNVSQLQSAHIAEEARDSALLAMPQDDAGNLDARNRRIVRLAPGIEGTDAINKNQLDTTLGEAGGILSDMKDLEGEIHDYIEKFADDTSVVRGVAWVYNLGSANGGENVITIDKPTRTYAVPYIEVNGSRQEVGYHYQFDLNTQSISLVKPLEKGDFLMAMTTESSVPLESMLASTVGASGIGTLNGMTVQERLDAMNSVSILEYHKTPYANFGAALEAAAAAAMSNGRGTILIPAGRYTSERAANITLSKGLRLVFAPDAWVTCYSPHDVINIDINKQHLNITANGARIMADWAFGLDASSAAAIRLKDDTLDKSCSVTDLKVGFKSGGGKFGHAIHGSAINLSTFYRCLLQGVYGIHIEASKDRGQYAHAMGNQIVGCEIFTTYDAITISNKGVLGCEGLLVFGCELLSDDTAIVIRNDGLNSQNYLPPLFRIEGNHLNSYRALYCKDVGRLHFVNNDVQSRYTTGKTPRGRLEVGGVQGFHHHGNTYSDAKVGTAVDSDKATPVFQFESTLANAYFISSCNNYWLDGATNPVYGFESTSKMSTIRSSGEILQSSASWTASGYWQYFRPDYSTPIGNAGASAGMSQSDGVTFSGGTLTVTRAPVAGSTVNVSLSVLPNTSQITRIMCASNLVGKTVDIRLSAAEVSVTHGSDLLCPDQKSFKLWLPNVVRVFFINTAQAVIVGYGGITASHTGITSPPATRTSPGYHGAEYFDAAGKYLYKYQGGYGWYRIKFEEF